MILPVYVEPQPILRTQTEPITDITPEIRELVMSMRDTMHNANGIGLAAPQVGSSLSVCIAEYEDRESGAIPFTALINPKIIWRSQKKSVSEEGCLSIPGIYGNVRRPEKVTVSYTDLDGKPRELSIDGLYARVIQHELDHLKGVLFTDYLSKADFIEREAPDYPRI